MRETKASRGGKRKEIKGDLKQRRENNKKKYNNINNNNNKPRKKIKRENAIKAVYNTIMNMR